MGPVTIGDGIAGVEAVVDRSPEVWSSEARRGLISEGELVGVVILSSIDQNNAS